MRIFQISTTATSCCWPGWGRWRSVTRRSPSRTRSWWGNLIVVGNGARPSETAKGNLHVFGTPGQSTRLVATSRQEAGKGLFASGAWFNNEGDPRQSWIGETDTGMTIFTARDKMDLRAATGGSLSVSEKGQITTVMEWAKGAATFHGHATVFGDEPALWRAVAWSPALTICGRKNPNAHELIGLATAAEGQKWHLNIHEPDGSHPGGLNVAETAVGDFRLFLADGGNVGIGTGAPSAKLHVAGDLQIDGTLRSTLKSFSIAHPLRPGEQLLHGSLEGPEAGVYYWGEGVLDGGTAVVQLPDYFEALTRPENRTVQLTAKGQEPFMLSYEDVADGRVVVHGSKSDGRFAWEVRAVRADVAPLTVESGPRSPGSSD